MAINLSRGCWRLWLFFNFVWVVFCAWQVVDARAQCRDAAELKEYYQKTSADARKLEQARGGLSPIVSANLQEQVNLNNKIMVDQSARLSFYLKMAWLVPLVTFVFAMGVPWVWEGFTRDYPTH